MINTSHMKNFKPAERSTRPDPLPAGAYVAGIIGAKTEDTQNGQILIVQVDVIEGPYTKYYRTLFDASQGGNFAARYKGIIRFNIPNGQDPNRDEWNQNRLENFAWDLRQSNSGFEWDGKDETKLKGKVIGILVREKEWIMEDTTNGGYRQGVTTEIGGTTSADRVREGKARPMKRRGLSEADRKKLADWESGATDGGSQFTPVEEENLPF